MSNRLRGLATRNHSIQVYISNSRHLARRYARIFCPRTLSVPRSEQFSESIARGNGELRGTDNVQGQISGHIFAPNGRYCLYYPSNIFRNTRSFKNWGISSDIPQFWLGNIRSRDAFRPIARERKYLTDYNRYYVYY